MIPLLSLLLGLFGLQIDSRTLPSPNASLETLKSEGLVTLFVGVSSLLVSFLLFKLKGKLLFSCEFSFFSFSLFFLNFSFISVLSLSFQIFPFQAFSVRLHVALSLTQNPHLKRAVSVLLFILTSYRHHSHPAPAQYTNPVFHESNHRPLRLLILTDYTVSLDDL